MKFLKNCKVDDIGGRRESVDYVENNKKFNSQQSFIRIYSTSSLNLEKSGLVLKSRKRRCPISKKALKWTLLSLLFAILVTGVGLIIHFFVPKAPQFTVVPIHKSNPKDIFNHLEITPDYMIIPLNLNLNVKNPNYYDLELISSNARLTTNIKETEFILSWGQLNANQTQRIKIDRRSSKEVSIRLDLKLNNNKEEKYKESVIFNLLRFHCNERKELRMPMEVKIDFDYDYQVSNWDPSLGNHLNWTVNWNCNWIINSTL